MYVKHAEFHKKYLFQAFYDREARKILKQSKQELTFRPKKEI